jgi:hypothetical protein
MADVAADCKGLRGMGKYRPFAPDQEDVQPWQPHCSDTSIGGPMLALALKILYYESLQFARRLKAQWLMLLLSVLPFVVHARCARRMEALATRLQMMRGKIERFEAHVLGGCFEELVDADRTIRAMLLGLKDDIRHIRCELAGLPKLPPGPGAARLDSALAQLHRIAEETYCAADRLIWEIDEHDLSRRSRGLSPP